MKIWGVTSGAEIDNAIDLIRNHPDLPNIHFTIADYLEVDEFHVSVYETLIVAARDHWVSEVNPNLKIALVADKAEIIGALQRYAASSVIKDTFEVCVFSALQDARNWVSEIKTGSGAGA